MSYKILETYLPSSVINHCIVPYLMPLEEDVRNNRKKLNSDFRTLIMNCLWIDTMTDRWHLNHSDMVLMALRKKYFNNYVVQ
jgi:hypothetical protein